MNAAVETTDQHRFTRCNTSSPAEFRFEQDATNRTAADGGRVKKKKISEKTLHFISLHTELTTDGVGCARSSFFNVLSEPTSAKNFRALICVFFLKTVFSRFTFRQLFVLKTSRTLPDGSDSLLPSPLTSHPDICSIRSRSLIVVDMTHESNHSHTPTISW